MGLHPDIQKLEEKGGFFADQKGDGGPRFRDVPIATPSRDEDADVEMKDSGGDGGRGPSGGDGGATPSGPPIVYHISLTGWMRSAFIAKTSEPTDDDVVMAEVDADDHDGEGKRVAVYMIDDLYARLAKRLSDVFYASEQVTTVWLVADKGRRCPPEKKATNDERAERGPEPYDHTVTLGDNGLIIKDEEASALRSGRGRGQESPFSVHRLMRTKRMRDDLYAALMKRCQADPQWEDKVIIWDMNESPPVHLHKRIATPRVDLDFPKIGEDDILMPLHAIQNKAQNIFCARDRDMKLILLLHRDRLPETCIADFGDGRHISIHQFAKDLIEEKWSIDAYVQASVLCGSDFFLRKYFGPSGVSVPLMMAVVLQLHRRGVDLMTRSGYTLFFRTVYSYKIGWKDRVGTKDELREATERYVSKNQFPSDETLERGYAWFRWNIRYWTSLQGTVHSCESVAHLGLGNLLASA